MRGRSGQATIEYMLLYAGISLPLVFALIFTAELLWDWHSIVEFTRAGAAYAATHCWQSSPDNVTGYMQQHIPPMVDQAEFLDGSAQIQVQYFSRDPDSGVLNAFTCDSGDCIPACVPDVVTVSVQNYEFRRFVAFLKLPPIPLPNFQTSVPMGSAGCNAESGTCTP